MSECFDRPLSGGGYAVRTLCMVALAVLVIPGSVLKAQGILPLPQPIYMTSISPDRVTPGTSGHLITIHGSGFRSGQQLAVSSPDVQVLSFQVLSPNLATAMINVLPGAAPGPVRLDINDPLTQATTVEIPTPPLFIYRSSGLAAPLGIRDAAIVYPQPGTLLSPDKPIYARGVLATTGTGVVIGRFLLDGVPFDQFAVVANGGAPVQVKTNVPIPFTHQGTHDLVLEVLTPQHFTSGAVRLIGSVDSRTSLKLLAPRDGAGFSSPPVFRWTLVPGAIGYEVLFRALNAPDVLTVKHFQTSQDHWTPSRFDWAELGGGRYRWSVRPVFPGRTPGTPAPWRDVFVQAGTFRVRIESPRPGPQPGSYLLRWTGGPEGTVYYLQFFGADNPDKPLFTALTRETSYLLKLPFSEKVVSYSVDSLDAETGRVRFGDGAHGRRLPSGRSSLAGFEPRLLLTAGPAAVTGILPADGATVKGVRPEIAARWSGSVDPDQISLFIDNEDVTAMADIQGGKIQYQPVMDLAPGTHTIRLSLSGTLKEWKITVRKPSAGEAAGGLKGAPSAQGQENTSAGAASKPESKPTGSWSAQAAGLLSEISGSQPDQQDTFRLTLSSQSDLGRGGWSFKDTADGSFRHDFASPTHTVNESRNWVFMGGYKSGDWGASGTVGYANVSFLGDSQLVASGLTRGGVEADVTTPAGGLGAYASYDDTVPALGSGSGASNLKVRAAGYTLPLHSDRFLVRFMGLWTDQDPSAYLPGGSGRVLGMLARLKFTPAFGLYMEAAQGRAEPDGQPSYEGNAYRLGFEGTVFQTTYALNFRRVAADFANPANPGYTQGGVPDRSGVGLDLSRSFGKLSASMNYLYSKDGVGTQLSGGPSGKQHVLTFQFALPLTTRVAVTLGLNGEKLTQDPDPVTLLPGTDQRMTGWNLGFTEGLGKVTFAQTYAGQRVRSHIDPAGDVNMDSFLLTANGSVTPSFQIGTTGSFSRTDTVLAGRTDVATVSISPLWSLWDGRFSILPRAAYTRTKNSLGTMDSRVEQYQFTLRWNPRFWHSFLSVEGTAEWNRFKGMNTGAYQPDTHRYFMNLRLSWGGGKGSLNEQGPGLGGTPPGQPIPMTGAGQTMGGSRL
jgi:hypothetical protein